MNILLVLFIVGILVSLAGILIEHMERDKTIETNLNKSTR